MKAVLKLDGKSLKTERNPADVDPSSKKHNEESSSLITRKRRRRQFFFLPIYRPIYAPETSAATGFPQISTVDVDDVGANGLTLVSPLCLNALQQCVRGGLVERCTRR